MSEFRGFVPDQLPSFLYRLRDESPLAGKSAAMNVRGLTYHNISALFKIYFGLVQTTADGANRYQRPFGVGQTEAPPDHSTIVGTDAQKIPRHRPAAAADAVTGRQIHPRGTIRSSLHRVRSEARTVSTITGLQSGLPIFQRTRTGPAFERVIERADFGVA